MSKHSKELQIYKLKKGVFEDILPVGPDVAQDPDYSALHSIID